MEILAAHPESVVRTLLNRDPDLSGLEITGAGLEDAFLALTEPHAEQPVEVLA
jgi:ABC-2 type transport system ATP-binding protein